MFRVTVIFIALAIGACKTASEGTGDNYKDAIYRRLMVPNYDSIKTWFENKQNRSVYNKLLERLRNYDTSLSISELHKLYFGWIFHPKYNPYNQEVLKIYASARYKIAGSQTGEVQLIETMEEIKQALKLDPFCLPCHYLMFMGFHIMGKEGQSRRVQKIIDKIAFVIRFSGMGTKEDPIRVISPHHADGFLFISGLKAKRKNIETVNDSIYLYIIDLEKQKSSKIKRLVFDITPAIHWQQKQRRSNEIQRGRAKDTTSQGH